MNLSDLINITVTNTTFVNETIGKATGFFSTIQAFIPLVFIRLWDLIVAPFHQSQMFWIILPLFVTLIVMEIYYGKNNDEELGWGSAIANSVLLIIVAIDLIRHSFNYATPWTVFRDVILWLFGQATLPIEPQILILISFIGLLGIGTMIINYYHLLPRKMAYVISSHPPMNYLAYFAIAIVYSSNTNTPIPFDLATLTAGVILFIILCLIVFGIKRMLLQFDNSYR